MRLMTSETRVFSFWWLRGQNPRGGFTALAYLFREQAKKEREREEKRRKKVYMCCISPWMEHLVLPFIPSPHALAFEPQPNP